MLLLYRSLSSQCSSDALLLNWAKAWAPPSTLGTTFRHPGYALLHWQRTHTMSTARLCQLLLALDRRASRPTAGAAPSAAAARAEQLLAEGDLLAALQALLPSSEQLLLPYAAQACHMRLLRELLAENDAAKVHMQATWWDGITVKVPALVPALRTAAFNAQQAALELLLRVFSASMMASNPQMAAGIHLKLLTDAIRGGASSCVDTMLALCAGALQRQPALQQAMLAGAVSTGNLAVVQALLDAGIGDPSDINVQWKALLGGRLEILQLLRVVDGDGDVDGEYHDPGLVCTSAKNMFTSERVVGQAERQQQLDMVRAAMWALRGSNRVGEHWRDALIGVMHCNSVPALETMWAQFAEHRGRLACSMVEAVAAMEVPSDNDASRWVLQHAVSALTLAESEHILDAADFVFKHGHLALLTAMVEVRAVTPAQLAGLQQSDAASASQLLHAVQRGDVGQIREAGRIIMLDNKMSQLAMALAITIEDTDTAVAMVQELVPKLEPSAVGLPKAAALRMHGSRLLQAMCWELPAFKRSILGDGARLKRTICIACSYGAMEAALWLACHPDQATTALSAPAWIGPPPRSIEDHKPLLGLTELLHKLAALPASAEWDGSGGEEGRRRQGAPAGGKHLGKEFLHLVLGCGNPDLVHGLLAYVDAWGPVEGAEAAL